ncbi:MAG: IS1 family transposase [Verrucomicrobiia bacterium]
MKTCLACGGEIKKFGSFKTRSGSVQRFRCLECGKTFNEQRRFIGLCLDEAKIVQIVRCLTEGVGVRATARLTGCDKNTVLEVVNVIGEKCERFHDEIVHDIKTESIQLDELWARVGLRQSRTTPEDKLRGDFFTYLGIDRRTKLIISHLTGKRDYNNTDTFVGDLASRVSGVVQITCDGYAPYVPTIRAHLLGRLNLAVMQKIYGKPDNQFDWDDRIRRYAPPKCTGIKLKTVAGEPDVDKICTSHVERLNLSVRTFNRRFTRLCLGFSRKLVNHRYSVALFVVAYNFCKRHETLGCTPAVGARLTDHTWTIEELIKRLSETI